MSGWTESIVLCAFECLTSSLRNVFVSVSVRVCVRGLYRGPAVEMMQNERMYCALCHLSISPLVSPQIDKPRDICHHQDKVECGMTGISNLHNKQWNSNYQPAQTISPAVTFGPQDCSIIHRHSRLANKKKREREEKGEKILKSGGEGSRGPDILMLV